MKLTGKIALCLASAFLLTSTAAWSQAPAPKDGKKYRIAYIARAQGDSFAAWLADSVVKEVKKYPDTQVTVFDGQSKNEMIARLKFLMDNGYFEDFDPTFCEQGLYFTFQKTQSGQFRAAGDAGHHDDTILARMLTTMALDMSRYKAWSESKLKDGRKY